MAIFNPKKVFYEPKGERGDRGGRAGGLFLDGRSAARELFISATRKLVFVMYIQRSAL